MPSQRRLKTFGLLVLIFVLITLYLTSSARQTRSSQFYTKTQDALAEARAHKEKAFNVDSDGWGGELDVGKRLREAEEAAKKAADRKGDAFHGEEGRRQAQRIANARGPEKSVAWNKVMNGEAVLKDKNGPATEEKRVETEEEHKVKNELNDILKKSPIIIFSKSYCPYSAKAKHILLESYKISPPPYVVELDLHPMGPQLQSKLATMTGRRTVPNVLINGRSIGGGDDVAQLHESGKLAETVRSMGGKRMVVTRVEEPASGDEMLKRRRKMA